MKKIAIIVLNLLVAIPAWAVLGQREQSITADQQRLRGQHTSVSRQGYTLHEIDAPDGMVIKEYVSPGGMVFGVSWQGPTMPDLQNLLGSHFSEFQQSATNAAGSHHRAFAMRSDRLVVESGGHMRSFRGRAYLPSLLPANVTEEVVQ